MRAWAAPVVDGIRQDLQEIELETDGLTILEHKLPWASAAYRYEYAPGEEIPTLRMTSRTATEEELPPQSRHPRWLAWLLGDL